MGDVAFDGVDVVADFAFAGGEGVEGAVGAEGGFDFGFVFLVWFGHGVADVLHYLHADWSVFLLLFDVLFVRVFM